MAGAAGCTLNAAPPGWLPTTKETAAYGGWIRLETADARAAPVGGELLALDSDSVWVTTRDVTVALPIAGIKKGTLTAYDPEAGKLGTWTLLGAVSTASHGVISIISLPVWVLGGSLATHAQASSARRSHPRLEWKELAMYARFPQGPPPGLDLRALAH